MPKPACVPCKRFFRPYHNGIRVQESKPIARDAKPGTDEEQNWAPYKGWYADAWKCEGCGAEIITGWGNQPFVEDFHPDAAVSFLSCSLKINDC
jgi:hypothetical protein